MFINKASIMFVLLFGYCNLVSQTNSDFTIQFNNQFHNSLSKANYDTIDIKQFSKVYDLSSYLASSHSEKIYGFIGNEFERIKVKIGIIKRDENNLLKYYITGKTMVEQNISKFNGNLELINIYEAKESVTRHNLIICLFRASFKEEGSSEHTGNFDGIYYLVLSKIEERILAPKAIPRYISNHCFAGNWKSNNGKINYPVLWGEDFLFEDLEDFNTGILNSKPTDDKIIEKSWKSYFDAFSDDNPEDVRNEAILKEKFEWWK